MMLLTSAFPVLPKHLPVTGCDELVAAHLRPLQPCGAVLNAQKPLPASISLHNVILYKHVTWILGWSLNTSHLNPPVVQQRSMYFKHDAFMIHIFYPIHVKASYLLSNAQVCASRCFIFILWFNPLCAGLYQCLPPDSREFEDLVKIVSSCYLDSSSRGSFSYCKARLIHNELLEKEVGREHFTRAMYVSVCAV